MLLPPFSILFGCSKECPVFLMLWSTNERTFPRARTLWTFLSKDVTHRRRNKENLNDVFRFSAQVGRIPLLLFIFLGEKNVFTTYVIVLWKSFSFFENNLFVFRFPPYSHELQTCDWPRNVGCLTGADASTVTRTKTASRPSNVDQKLGSPLTQFLDSE